MLSGEKQENGICCFSFITRKQSHKKFFMKILYAVAALFFASPSFGQLTGDTSTHLDQVVITANKYQRKQSETGKVVTVLDEATLQAMNSRSLGEVLNTVSGTTIIGANNNLGTNQRISIRGASDGNVLLLLNGVPLNDPSLISNYFDLNFLDLTQVSRIEILKGGQSTLYGSDAVAGVINIITKQPAPSTIHGTAYAAYGSYGTSTIAGSIHGTLNKFFYSASARNVNSNGFSSAFDSTGKNKFDRDAFNQTTGRLDIGLNVTPAVVGKVFFGNSFYKTDVDAGAFRDDKDFIAENKNLTTGATVEWKQPKGFLKFNYLFNNINRYYLDDSTDKVGFSYFSDSKYIGNSHFAELYQSWKSKYFEILFGADYRYWHTLQDYLSVSSYGPFQQPSLDDNASQLSGFGSVIFRRSNLNVEIGGRWNHHSQYNNNFTYTFNPSLLLNGNLKVYANLSSAYKVPSLFQLYDPFAGFSELQPEKTVEAEAGLDQMTNAGRFRATAFWRKTNNAIQYVITDPANYQGHYININAQRNYGLEAEYTLRLQNWLIQSNYTFTKGAVISPYSSTGDLLTKDTTYNNLYRVPEHAINCFAQYSFSRFSVSSLLTYASERLEPIYGALPAALKTFYTVDFSGTYRFSKSLNIFADIRNITNQQYFDVLGYNSRRFNFTTGVRLTL